MSIPDYQSLMLPVLLLTADGDEYPVSRLRTQVGVQLALTEEQLAERLGSGSQTVFASRVSWAVQYLKQAGVLLGVRRGVYRITERGRSLLDRSLGEITVKTLRQFPEFVEFQRKGAAVDVTTDSTGEVSEAEATPEELLERSYQVLREALAQELLQTIKNGTPAGFEQIVVDLLVAMGYGGSVEDAGKVVGKSGDGGIDGVIKQDKLGLDAIYVQAKRWSDVVGSPEVMKFSGSLTRKHANRGVFITTSSFTKDAVEFVQEISQKIVLIDGKQLASLMIEHNVGVSSTRRYTLKRLDQDYFENI